MPRTIRMSCGLVRPSGISTAFKFSNSRSTCAWTKLSTPRCNRSPSHMPSPRMKPLSYTLTCHTREWIRYSSKLSAHSVVKSHWVITLPSYLGLGARHDGKAATDAVANPHQRAAVALVRNVQMRSRHRRAFIVP